MKTFKKDNISVFMSNDMHKDHYRSYLQDLPLRKATDNRGEDCLSFYGWLFELDVWMILNSMSKNQIEYIKLFSEKNLLPHIALLIAHGAEDGLSWQFYDNDEIISMQTWLDRHDGDYSCIICNVCNPFAYSVKTKKSLLVIPDNVLSIMRLNLDTCHLSLLHPKLGEIDGYIIRHEIQRLQKA